MFHLSVTLPSCQSGLPLSGQMLPLSNGISIIGYNEDITDQDVEKVLPLEESS